MLLHTSPMRGTTGDTIFTSAIELHYTRIAIVSEIKDKTNTSIDLVITGSMCSPTIYVDVIFAKWEMREQIEVTPALRCVWLAFDRVIPGLHPPYPYSRHRGFVGWGV